VQRERNQGARPFVIAAGLLIGLVVLVGAVGVGANLLRQDSEPPVSLRRPAAGEVRADYLPDGTPVWVIGHEDGSADVLSGFDTHVPSNLGKLLWWCPSARALDNPHHGSKWDEYGVKLGGPAPSGLPSWEVTVQGGRILLGSMRPAPPLNTSPRGPSEINREWCTHPEDEVIAHTFDGWRLWDSPTAAVEAASENWILLEGELVASPAENAVRLCALDGCADSVLATNVEMPPRDDEFGPLGPGQFIAHARDRALHDVTRVVILNEAAPAAQ
jgi:hypothetical protein